MREADIPIEVKGVVRPSEPAPTQGDRVAALRAARSGAVVRSPADALRVEGD
jgi:hypothetical protein